MEFVTAAASIIGGAAKGGAFGGGSSGPISTSISITPRDRSGDYLMLAIISASALAALMIYNSFKG